ncbi:class I SAM-dependent methyltransferase [Coralloluteibacterium stylophorae]|uniref:Class I SAM-dependent methyltransferase n=1 Tax=Coralloluteibacterium stylophorae TaxID=1776034 RepID=A0A8J7VTB2_9GAMM|nr:class I SAM-dependent methyltransferase [Coralloluteibacterium stylophorae]MBS7457637.1 class I SAM-dependent methyltransferase [Coralloluteibacterium stylophorae]
MLLEKLRTRLRPSALAPARCPACGPSLLVRIGDDETAVRCLRCRGTPVHLSLIAVLCEAVEDLAGACLYELSAGGAALRFYRARCGAVTASEFLAGVPAGTVADGVRCEDAQRLSFADASFDVCTSTEVFEHVADDARGFAGMLRVLRPGGLLAFTVPLAGATTVERACLREDGGIEHRLPPEYHGDRLVGEGGVLALRNYGRDIVARLRDAGFAWAAIVPPRRRFLGHAREVVLARKAG